MLTISDLWHCTRGICAKYDIPLPDVIRYNGRLSATLGRCLVTIDDSNNSGTYSIIELNKKFCQINTGEVTVAVLKHELAHLVHYNHGPGFAALCKKMGIKTHTDETFKNIKYAKPKYNYKCPACGQTFPRTQKFKGIVSCAECGQKKYNKKYELVLMD